MSVIRITVDIYDLSGRKVDIQFASNTGCLLTANGAVYPSELDLINDIVKLVRERKDKFPPEVKQRAILDNDSNSV